MDGIDAVATNYSILFTTCSNVFLGGCMLKNIGLTFHNQTWHTHVTIVAMKHYVS